MLCYEADSVRRPGGRERHPGRGNLSKNNIPTISTGNILREALKERHRDGPEGQTYMESGKLVPDEILIGIIKDRLAQDDCKNGFILDGFPRTIPQAEALDTMGVEIDAVLDIEVADEDIVTRMSGRRVCEKSAAPPTMCCTNSPVEEGKCDICGGTLVQRKDDHPDTVKERLEGVPHSDGTPSRSITASRASCLWRLTAREKVEDTTHLVLEALEDLT